ncbi:MAG: OmpA family protein [Gemmobacter sp.]|uniref:OmpA family protein n=1 Tax=Gemmobacter sp. TaxID=1898957 RepID=UPI001A61FA73|nr:OmpA family protein [Gemmobacter sp.]MBL8562618.1 OmpA family protein [Gemmobacter sp.]
MKRLLIATTALSVALSGMQPGLVLAQTVAEELCPNGKAPPCKGKRQKGAPEEGGAGGNVNPLFQAPEGEGKPSKEGKPKREKPAAEEPAAEEPVKPRKEGKPKREKPAAEEPAAEEPVKPRKQGKPAAEEPAKPRKPAAEEPAKPRKEKPAPQPERQPAPKPAPTLEEGGNVTPLFQSPDTAEPQPVKRPKPAPAAEEEQVRKDGKPAKDGKPVAPKKPLREPAPDAEVALEDIFAQPKAEDGRPARKPAAALDGDATAKAGSDDTRPRKERKRVTKEDVRSSSEEFGERTTPRKPDIFRKPDEPAKPGVEKKGGGGLSDLEKAGLVVLGALAVGALLKNGDRVVSNTGDRVVVDRGNGQYVVLKDDDTLLRQPGTEVETETFVDGSTRTTIYRPDGSRVVTVRDASGRVLQRVAVDPWGRETLLIDDLGREVRPVDVSRLPPAVPRKVSVSASNQNALAAALAQAQTGQLEGSYSLQQVRDYPQLRAYAPMVDVENIRFGSGLSAIDPAEATKLQALGSFMAETIRKNPGEMFLIEGHTDAVGDAVSNLALSDRRAESLALALTEYFGVPPENMVVQGYGEGELLVNTQAAEVQNRRTVVRMISGLLNGN